MTVADGRLQSLDAFRGFAIAAMMLVNNPGDWSHLYAPLAHAEWNGWAFTDTIFPFFLFICGVAMPLSVARRRAQGATAATLRRQFVVRAAIIFAVGVLLNAIPRAASLLYAVVFDLALFAVAWALWKRRWFIRA